MSMYDFSVPAFDRALANLSAVLAKGAAHAEAKGVAGENYTSARLIPDMHPLNRQVHFVCDTAKFGAARLAGVEAPAHPDTEVSFDELQARIANVRAFIATISREQIDGSEERDVTIKTPRGDLNFKGFDYLNGFVLPNLYFHSTMTYALLRAAGVDVGKMDFLGAR
jgi:uncharacterized protein